MTTPFTNRLPSNSLGGLATALLLSLSIQSWAAPLHPNIHPPRAQTPSDRARLDQIETIAKEAEVARDLAVSKVGLLENKIKEREKSIGAVDTEIFQLRDELAQRKAGKWVEKTPTKTRPTSRIKDGLPTESLNKVTPQVVILEGDQGNGNRQITVRDSTGQVYRKFDFIECAEGVDLVRLKPKKPGLQGLELVTAENAPKVGDVIVAVGNSLGTGSISGESGRVTSIEDDMWEVDAEIIPGNSGGPVLALNSGKVVGIVTHLTIHSLTEEGGRSKTTDVKRFAARLDKEWKWRRMPVTRFVKEWQHIEKMSLDSSVTWAGIVLMQAGAEMKVDREAVQIANQIITENRKHSHAQRIDTWLKSFRKAGATQKRGLITEGNKMIEQLQDEIRLGSREPEAEDFSWYHRQTYEPERDWRNKLSN